MQVKVSDRDENNIVTVSVETEEGHGKEAYSKTLKRLSENVNIKGFRKGKVPAKIVEEHYGAEAVRAETLNNEFLGKLLDQAFAAEELNVVHINQIEKVEFNNPEEKITVEAKVELFPEVKLPDVSKIKLSVKVPQVDAEKQYQEAMERIVLNNSEYEEAADAAIEMGDEIFLDFDGSFKNDKGEWEAKPGMKAEDFQTVVEPGRFIENFLEQTVGMKVDDESDIEVKFPEGYHDDELSGKDAKFKVKIKKLAKPVKPELNDEFAKGLGLKDLAELEQRVKDEIQKIADDNKRSLSSEAVVKELLDQTEVQLSQAMVDRELDHDMLMMKQQNGWTDEQFKAFVPTMDIEKENAAAREKLKRSVVLTTVIKEEKLESSPEEVQAEFSKLNLPPEFDTSKLDMQSIIHNLNLNILTNKAIDFLIEKADLEYEEVPEEELVAAGHHVHGPNCNH